MLAVDATLRTMSVTQTMEGVFSCLFCFIQVSSSVFGCTIALGKSNVEPQQSRLYSTFLYS